MEHAEKIILILVGNFLVAIGTVFFVVPAGFITGGVTGFALAFEQFFHLPISYGIAILSILLLVLGWIILGKTFAASSALSAVSFPVFVWICERVVKYIDFTTDNMLLNLAFASLLFGYGVALVMRQGASTGGFDTIAMILYKKKGVSLALSVNILEIIAMLPQLTYSTSEEIMGGILLTIFYTSLMNFFIAQGVAQVQVMIYSKKYEEINRYIDTQLRRGSTLFQVQGGYEREDTYALQTIISNRELFQLKEAVLKIDKVAFMTISEVSRVAGKGFSLDSDVPGDSRKGRSA